MGFRTAARLRNPSETAQRLSLAGWFRGFEGFGVYRKDRRDVGVGAYRPSALPTSLEAFGPAPKPQNPEISTAKPCTRQGSSGFAGGSQVRNPGVDDRLGVVASRLDGSWAELDRALDRALAAIEELTASQLDHVEKGPAPDLQTSSFKVEVLRCL